MSLCIRNGVTFKRHNRTKNLDGSWGRCVHCQPDEPVAPIQEESIDRDNLGAVEMGNEGGPTVHEVPAIGGEVSVLETGHEQIAG